MGSESGQTGLGCLARNTGVVIVPPRDQAPAWSRACLRSSASSGRPRRRRAAGAACNEAGVSRTGGVSKLELGHEERSSGRIPTGTPAGSRGLQPTECPGKPARRGATVARFFVSPQMSLRDTALFHRNRGLKPTATGRRPAGTTDLGGGILIRTHTISLRGGGLCATVAPVLRSPAHED